MANQCTECINYAYSDMDGYHCEGNCKQFSEDTGCKEFITVRNEPCDDDYCFYCGYLDCRCNWFNNKEYN